MNNHRLKIKKIGIQDSNLQTDPEKKTVILAINRLGQGISRLGPNTSQLV